MISVWAHRYLPNTKKNLFRINYLGERVTLACYNVGTKHEVFTGIFVFVHNMTHPFPTAATPHPPHTHTVPTRKWRMNVIYANVNCNIQPVATQNCSLMSLFFSSSGWRQSLWALDWAFTSTRIISLMASTGLRRWQLRALHVMLHYFPALINPYNSQWLWCRLMVLYTHLIQFQPLHWDKTIWWHYVYRL